MKSCIIPKSMFTRASFCSNVKVQTFNGAFARQSISMSSVQFGLRQFHTSPLSFENRIPNNNNKNPFNQRTQNSIPKEKPNFTVYDKTEILVNKPPSDESKGNKDQGQTSSNENPLPPPKAKRGNTLARIAFVLLTATAGLAAVGAYYWETDPEFKKKALGLADDLEEYLKKGAKKPVIRKREIPLGKSNNADNVVEAVNKVKKDEDIEVEENKKRQEQEKREAQRKKKQEEEQKAIEIAIKDIEEKMAIKNTNPVESSKVQDKPSPKVQEKVLESKPIKVVEVVETKVAQDTPKEEQQNSKMVENLSKLEEKKELQATVIEQIVKQTEEEKFEREQEYKRALRAVVELEEEKYKERLKRVLENKEKEYIAKYEELQRDVNDQLGQMEERWKDEAEKIMEKRIKRIKREFEVKKTEEVVQIMQQYEQKHQERLAELDQLANQLKEHEKILQQASAREKLIHQTYQLQEAYRALSQTVQQGRPFSAELDNVLKTSGEQDIVKQSIHSLPENVSKVGIPTVDQLRNDFKRVVPEGRRLELLRESKDNSWTKVLSVISAPTSGSEKSLITGDVFARAEFYLERGNVESALRELQELRGPSANLVEPWIYQAKQHLMTQQAIEILRAHIADMQKSTMDN